MLNDRIRVSLAELADCLLSHSLKLGTAESCTGGGLSYVITALSGSSRWFERGLVTYSNQSKISLLGVSEHVLKQFGAVSKETAEAMVRGLLKHHPVDVGVAITGIAGPDGGSVDKPVGLVWIAWEKKNFPLQSRRFQFEGDREDIRIQSILASLHGLLDYLRLSFA